MNNILLKNYLRYFIIHDKEITFYLPEQISYEMIIDFSRKV